jgi:hypothetical protein
MATRKKPFDYTTLGAEDEKQWEQLAGLLQWGGYIDHNGKMTLNAKGYKVLEPFLRFSGLPLTCKTKVVGVKELHQLQQFHDFFFPPEMGQLQNWKYFMAFQQEVWIKKSAGPDLPSWLKKMYEDGFSQFMAGLGVLNREHGMQVWAIYIKDRLRYLKMIKQSCMGFYHEGHDDDE